MRILVVENQPHARSKLVEYLSVKGHIVEGAHCGLVGLNLAASKAFDAIVLDAMLPGINGKQICYSLRYHSQSQVGIVMLSARDDLAERLAGFKVGADDFITKPYAMSEVLARLEAVVSRLTRRGNRVLRVDTLRFDLDTFEIHRDRTRLRFNTTCLKLLEVLMRRSPGVVTRGEMEDLIRGKNVSAHGCLRTNIHLLRRVLDKEFDQPLLHTVHGLGYKLAIE